MNNILEVAVIEQQEAIAWLPIIVVIGGIIIAALGTIKYIGKGNKIAILGMQSAGKTQLLRNLQGRPYSQYDATATVGSEEYESFTMNLGDRKVKIKKGKDIGGGEENCKPYYEDLIKENDIIFFLFNAKSFKQDNGKIAPGYLDDKKYQEQTQARLDFIYENIQNTSKRTVIFATFADKIGGEKERKEAYKNIKSSVSEKPYKDLFKNNFLLVNMQDRENIMKVLNEKIFRRRIFGI